jgi:hypothetical protein
MAIHRGDHWTPEEDQRLLELIGSGKSWVLISALLKRSQLSIRPSTAFETEVSQIQAARIAQGGCERVVLLNKAPPCPVYDLANSTTRLQDRAIRREI